MSENEILNNLSKFKAKIRRSNKSNSVITVPKNMADNLDPSTTYEWKLLGVAKE